MNNYFRIFFQNNSSKSIKFHFLYLCKVYHSKTIGPLSKIVYYTNKKKFTYIINDTNFGIIGVFMN